MPEVSREAFQVISDVEVVPSSIDSDLSMIQRRIMKSDFPFYQINVGNIFQQFVRWKNLLPRVQPFYAMKCQPDLKVISLLGNLGAGFDCASKHEIQTVIETMSYNKAQTASNIIFANPFKFKKDISYANRVGVTTVTFDTESELVKLSQEWPTVQLVLRISPPRFYNSTCILGNKFGADADEVPFLLQRAKELSMDIIGLSFHVGSGCQEMDAYLETVIYCSEIMELAREMGFNPTYLDLGGGFPGLSSIGGDLNKQMKFEEMCSKLNDVLDEYFPEEHNYRIIAEPGRYFVYGAYTLFTDIIGVRSLDLLNPTANVNVVACNANSSNQKSICKNSDIIEKGYRYVINDGVYNSFNCIIFDHAKPIPYGIFDNEFHFRKVEHERELFISTVYGPTCDGFDCLIQQERLPKMEIGNWIMWPNMGAYTIAASSSFNGIQKAECYYYILEEVAKEMNKFLNKTFE